MKYLKQLAYIFLLCAAGQFLSILMGGVIPGNVLAMILLFVLLVSQILPLKTIEETTDYILANMAFFFVPACAGILDSYELLLKNLLPLLIICVIATILTGVSAGLTVKFVLKLMNHRRKDA